MDSTILKKFGSQMAGLSNQAIAILLAQKQNPQNPQLLGEMIQRFQIETDNFCHQWQEESQKKTTVPTGAPRSSPAYMLEP